MISKQEINDIVFNIMNTKSEGVDYNKIITRYEHSIRVANICDLIASQSDINSYSAYIAGAFHDICKLSSTNHAWDAGAYLSENGTYYKKLLELKDYNELSQIINAIKNHSNKFIIDDNSTGLIGILKDADMIDKASMDAIFQCTDGVQTLTKRINALNQKLSVLKRYTPHYEISKKYIQEGIERLENVIWQLENCYV